MHYTFKPLPEGVRLVLVAMAIPVALALANFQATTLDNPKPWLIGLAVAAIQAGAAVVLHLLTAPSGPPSAPTGST